MGEFIFGCVCFVCLCVYACVYVYRMVNHSWWWSIKYYDVWRWCVVLHVLVSMCVCMVCTYVLHLVTLSCIPSVNDAAELGLHCSQAAPSPPQSNHWGSWSVRMYGVYVCVRMYVCINSFTHCVLCKGDLLTTLLKCDFSLNLCPYFCLMLINIFFQDNKISVGSQE